MLRQEDIELNGTIMKNIFIWGNLCLKVRIKLGLILGMFGGGGGLIICIEWYNSRENNILYSWAYLPFHYGGELVTSSI